MWLLKTEPGEYSWADLVRAGRATWDGVTNPVALKHLRAMKAGERAIVYHTGDERAAVGVARVLRAAYPDPNGAGDKLVVIDIEPVAPLARRVTLAELKSSALFAQSPLVRQGRLSVVPLTPEQWAAIETGRGL